jgi:hypothetical protein
MPKINTEPRVQITVRIAAGTAERTEAYARKTQIPKSIHVQIALNEYLDKRNAPDPPNSPNPPT